MKQPSHQILRFLLDLQEMIFCCYSGAILIHVRASSKMERKSTEKLRAKNFNGNQRTTTS